MQNITYTIDATTDGMYRVSAWLDGTLYDRQRFGSLADAKRWRAQT